MGNVTVMLINAAPQPQANSFHLKPETGNLLIFVEFPLFFNVAILSLNYLVCRLQYLGQNQICLHIYLVG